MALYRLHDLILTVESDMPETEAEVIPLLQDLSFVCLSGREQCPSLSLTLRRHPQALHIPRGAHTVFRTERLWGGRLGNDFYLTEGSSLFRLQGGQRRGDALLAPAFFHQPPLLRHQFWAFGVLKLLRTLGLYGLHAAGLVTETGRGLLLVGDSGCGKSTLTIGLVRQGWGYLSDDAVLLRQPSVGIEAVAFRKPCSVEAQCVAAYADLPLGGESLQPSGRSKRRVDLDRAYSEQSVPRCFPQMVLFQHLVPDLCSTVRPLERPRVLQHLLSQSGPPLFDRETMSQHLEVLKHLVQQATTYELLAGHDLSQHPRRLVSLLAAAEGEAPWRG